MPLPLLRPCYEIKLPKRVPVHGLGPCHPLRYVCTKIRKHKQKNDPPEFQILGAPVWEMAWRSTPYETNEKESYNNNNENERMNKLTCRRRQSDSAFSVRHSFISCRKKNGSRILWNGRPRHFATDFLQSCYLLVLTVILLACFFYVCVSLWTWWWQCIE